MDNYGKKHLIQHILDAGWGFIFKNEDGKYLTQHLWWYPHEVPEEAYVHNVAIFDCENWDVSPYEIIPAKYEDGVVTVLGDPIPYNKVLQHDQKSAG